MRRRLLAKGKVKMQSEGVGSLVEIEALRVNTNGSGKVEAMVPGQRGGLMELVQGEWQEASDGMSERLTQVVEPQSAGLVAQLL